MKSDCKNLKKVIAVGIVAVMVMTVFAWMVSAQAPTNANTIPPGQQGSGAKTIGDNPPTTSYTWTGNGDVVIDVYPTTATSNPSGSFTISGIPVGSTVVKAYMYTTSWESSVTDVSATLNGNILGNIAPFAYDSDGSYYYLCAWRWDVTSIVTGNGVYPFTTSGLDQHYGSALAVIYSNPTASVKQIIINDGAESLQESTSTTTFSGVQIAGEGTLILFTQADDETGTSESISFNGVVILGPGNIFNANQGDFASLFELPIHTVKDDNTASITTDVDWFGWHLAILVAAAPSCSVEYAVYQAGVPNPDGILNPLRELRDDNLKGEYVDRYYDYSPELTMVVTRDPALAYEAARLLVKYSPMVKQEVYGIGMDKLITRGDVAEIASFTNRLKRGVWKNREDIGTERSRKIIKFLDEFKGQVKASEGRTFSEALQGSIYCEDEQMPDPRGNLQHRIGGQ